MVQKEHLVPLEPFSASMLWIRSLNRPHSPVERDARTQPRVRHTSPTVAFSVSSPPTVAFSAFSVSVSRAFPVSRAFSGIPAPEELTESAFVRSLASRGRRRETAARRSAGNRACGGVDQ